VLHENLESPRRRERMVACLADGAHTSLRGHLCGVSRHRVQLSRCRESQHKESTVRTPTCHTCHCVDSKDSAPSPGRSTEGELWTDQGKSHNSVNDLDIETDFTCRMLESSWSSLSSFLGFLSSTSSALLCWPLRQWLSKNLSWRGPEG
jgi:hypothetical protein